MALLPGRIISRGVYVVPTPTAGEFIVGSTYQHEPFPPAISEEGKAQLLERLARLVNLPAEPVHQDWGIRPTVTDRRPLLGSHPRAANVIIFNGLGTKGVSLAPYFASRLADWVDGIAALPDEVNISRFKALYSN
jgi:glycine/D-amino acid oxidase-like deaminating enzyme